MKKKFLFLIPVFLLAFFLIPVNTQAATVWLLDDAAKLYFNYNDETYVMYVQNYNSISKETTYVDEFYMTQLDTKFYFVIEDSVVRDYTVKIYKVGSTDSAFQGAVLKLPYGTNTDFNICYFDTELFMYKSIGDLKDNSIEDLSSGVYYTSALPSADGLVDVQDFFPPLYLQVLSLVKVEMNPMLSQTLQVVSTLTLCGVGYLALLISLPVLRKVFNRFLVH